MGSVMYTGGLNRIRHIPSPDGLITIFLSEGFVLGQHLVHRSQAECTVQALGREGEPPIAWDQLTGKNSRSHFLDDLS